MRRRAFGIPWTPALEYQNDVKSPPAIIRSISYLIRRQPKPFGIEKERTRKHQPSVAAVTRLHHF